MDPHNIESAPVSAKPGVVLPAGLRDDVLSPTLSGSGHLAGRFKCSDAAAPDFCDGIDPTDDQDCIEIVHAVVNGGHPVFPAKENTRLVYTMLESIDDEFELCGDSLEGVWTRLLYGWNALLELSHLPGWVAQRDATTGRYVPGLELHKLAELTAAALGNAERVDMISVVQVVTRLRRLNATFPGLLLPAVVSAAVGTLDIVCSDPDLRLDLVDVEWDQLQGHIDALMAAAAAEADEPSLAALEALLAATEQANAVCEELIASAEANSGSFNSDDSASDSDAPDAASSHSGWSFYGNDFWHDMSREEQAAFVAWEEDEWIPKAEADRNDMFAKLLSYYGCEAERAAELRAMSAEEREIEDPDGVEARLLEGIAAEGAELLQLMEEEGIPVGYVIADEEEAFYQSRVSEKAMELFRPAAAGSVPQSVAGELDELRVAVEAARDSEQQAQEEVAALRAALAEEAAALAAVQAEAATAQKKLAEQGQAHAKVLAARDAELEEALSEACSMRREKRAAVAAAQSQAAAAFNEERAALLETFEKERAALHAAVEEEQAGAAARVAAAEAAVLREREDAAAAVAATQEKAGLEAAKAQAELAALESENQAAAVAAATSAAALAEAQQQIAAAAAEAAAARKEAAIARSLVQALQSQRNAAAAAAPAPRCDAGCSASPATLHMSTQTCEDDDIDASVASEEEEEEDVSCGSCSTDPDSPPAPRPDTPTAGGDDVGCGSAAFHSETSSPQHSETAFSTASEGESTAGAAALATTASSDGSSIEGIEGLETIDLAAASADSVVSVGSDGGEPVIEAPAAAPSPGVSPALGGYLAMPGVEQAQAIVSLASIVVLEEPQQQEQPPVAPAAAASGSSGRAAPRLLRAAAVVGGPVRRLKASMDDRAAAKKQRKEEKRAAAAVVSWTTTLQLTPYGGPSQAEWCINM